MPILEQECPLRLKRELMNGRDYVLLTQKSWQEFMRWYGGGPEIMRHILHKDGITGLELFPPIVSIMQLDEDGNEKQKRNFILSNSMKLFDLKMKVLSTMKISQPFIIQIQRKGIWTEIDYNLTVEEHGIVDYDELLIDVQNTTDKKRLKSKKNINYSDGSLIQVKRQGNNWETGIIIRATATKVLIKFKNQTTELHTIDSHMLQPPKQQSSYFHHITGPGTVGLTNLGNTCYINSIIQCISNTPLLKDFLLSNSLRENINMTNTKGSKGQLVSALQKLLNDIWNGLDTRPNLVKFKTKLSELYVQFQGYDQHDCHEFLSILLDNLHEDLLRITGEQGVKSMVIQNPTRQQENDTVEKLWGDLQGLQGSVISDLCGGISSTKIVCKSCGDSREIFELFTSLSLPIPTGHDIVIYAHIVPIQGNITAVGLCISQFANVFTLIQKISQISGIAADTMIFTEIQQDRIFSVLNQVEEETLKRNGIRNGSQICAYEVLSLLPQTPKYKTKGWGIFQVGDRLDALINGTWQTAVVKAIQIQSGSDLLLAKSESNNQEIWATPNSGKLSPLGSQCPILQAEIINIEILQTSVDLSSQTRNTLGIPMIISISDTKNLTDLHITIFQTCKRLISPQLLEKQIALATPNGIQQIKLNNTDTPFDQHSRNVAPYRIVILDKSGTKCGSCMEGCLGCPLAVGERMLKQVSHTFESVILAIEWDNGAYNSNTEFHPSYSEMQQRQNSYDTTIDISQCFNSYTEPENLEHACEKCQSKQCSIQMAIWKIPDILILCLKRFTFQNGLLDKIDTKVEFPLWQFNISDWVQNQYEHTGLTMSTNALSKTYDLYAVVSHSGDLTGGHYTSFCLQEDRWIAFDDNDVLEVNEVANIIPNNAYLLFYKRRNLSASNVINITSSYVLPFLRG